MIYSFFGIDVTSWYNEIAVPFEAIGIVLSDRSRYLMFITVDYYVKLNFRLSFIRPSILRCSMANVSNLL